MATSRVINTNFWKDSYIAELDPIEKLLFLYFITNPQTTLAGVYEINLREVAFDTGIDKDMVVRILSKFCADNKMYYENNWLILNNFLKHQRINPSIIRGIEKAFYELPQWIQEKINIDNIVNSESPQLELLTPVTIQTDTRLGIDSPQYKEKKLKEIKRNINKYKTGIADKPRDEIGSLYFQIIKKYKLPVRNNNNVVKTIERMKKEDDPEQIILYLQFLLDKYGGLDFSHKPELSEALDIYAKRMQIINAVKRTANRQNMEAVATLKVR